MTMANALAVDTVQAEQLHGFADGLDVLIRFHDRELDTDLLGNLLRYKVPEGMHELLISDQSREALQVLIAALQEIGPTPDEDTLDLLAAEYADLYLTHAYRVSPNGSVWLTEDKLERQLPMFDVRDWFDHYGVSVPDWRIRADDHLVHELQFVSFLFRSGSLVGAQDAARFLDLHVLPWVPDFCQQASERVGQPFYGAVLHLTEAYLEDLRQILESITGQERQVRVVAVPGANREPEPEATPFVPGVAESW